MNERDNPKKSVVIRAGTLHDRCRAMREGMSQKDAEAQMARSNEPDDEIAQDFRSMDDDYDEWLKEQKTP